MADISDVLNAIVAAINNVVYPNGTSQPSILGSATVRVYPGWPTSSLDGDLTAGTANISVFPRNIGRNTTRYPRDWQEKTAPVHTLTMTVDGNEVTVGGTFSTAVAQNTVVIVDDVLFQYSCQAGDTPASIATALAALINAQFEASASDGVITVPAAHSLVARVGGYGVGITEVRRQWDTIQISFWCNSPAQRDALAAPVDAALAAINFISLADGTTGRLRAQWTGAGPYDDKPQKEVLYVRHLFYDVEYGTTITSQVAEAIGVTTTTQGSAVSFSDMTPSEPPPQITNA